MDHQQYKDYDFSNIEQHCHNAPKDNKETVNNSNNEQNNLQFIKFINLINKKRDLRNKLIKENTKKTDTYSQNTSVPMGVKSCPNIGLSLSDDEDNDNIFHNSDPSMTLNPSNLTSNNPQSCLTSNNPQSLVSNNYSHLMSNNPQSCLTPNNHSYLMSNNPQSCLTAKQSFIFDVK